MSFRGHNSKYSDSDSDLDLNPEEYARFLNLNLGNQKDSYKRSRSPRSHHKNREIETASILANMATGAGGNATQFNLPGQQNPAANNININNAPVFKAEYLQMVPEFNGHQPTLCEFLRLGEELITAFYDHTVDTFQNKYLINSLKNKVIGKARDNISTYNITSWADLKNALLSCYSDKRDTHTLTVELCEMRQGRSSPIEFFNAIQQNINLQIAYCNNHFLSPKREILTENVTQLGLRIFLKFLNRPLGDYITTRNPCTLQDALHILTNDFQINSKNTGPSTGQNNVIKPYFAPRTNQFSNQRTPVQPHQQYRPNFYQKPNVNASSNVFRPRPNFTPRDQPTPMSISTRNTYQSNQSNQANNFQRKPYKNQFSTVQELHNIEQSASQQNPVNDADLQFPSELETKPDIAQNYEENIPPEYLYTHNENVYDDTDPFLDEPASRNLNY